MLFAQHVAEFSIICVSIFECYKDWATQTTVINMEKTHKDCRGLGCLLCCSVEAVSLVLEHKKLRNKINGEIPGHTKNTDKRYTT